MTNKKVQGKSWDDIQVVIATIAMALTLFFWNLFAGPDRVSALKRAQEQAVLEEMEREKIAQEQAAAQSQVLPAPTQIIGQPTPMSGPILLGGNAPQTVIEVNSGGGGGGGGGANSGGGTGSS